MEINLVFDGKFPASQTLDDTRGQVSAAEHELLAGLDEPLAGHHVETFGEHVLLVRAAEPCPRRRSGPLGERGRRRQAVYRSHELAERDRFVA
jgi:hypothetical protein